MTDLIDDVSLMTHAGHAAAQEQHGVYPSQWIAEAIRSGIVIPASPIGGRQIQPNSLDLRLGEIAYRVNCSFLPGREGLWKKLPRFKWDDLPISRSGTILEQNRVYLFPLQESLSLPENIGASANPKSTTGRLDVFTRLVTETGTAFDTVPAGYTGPLFLEVVPRSFAIKVRPGDALAQLRFHTGDYKLSDAATRSALDEDVLVVDSRGEPLHSKELSVSSGIVLSISLSGTGKESLVGYRAQKNRNPIDLRDRILVHDYWDNIYCGRGPVILEPDEFYIFASKQLVRLPPNYCAEMVPFDPSSGELRTHYAGFFDSGFGYSHETDAVQSAAAVVLEIRNRDVPFLIEEGQPLFRLMLLRNTAEPDMLYGQSTGSNYQSQRLKLSKQFRQRKTGPHSAANQRPLGI